MLSRIFHFLHRGSSRRSDVVAVSRLPSIPREQVAHLLVIEEGLPQVDWGMADAWIAHQGSSGKSPENDLRRAIAAAWLDELRDAVSSDSRRWRTAHVEGLAPLEGNIGLRVAKWAERSIRVLDNALKEIRGDPRANPIPPIAVVVLGTADEYYSFISHYYEEEGEYATSGGIYLRSSADSFPAMAINAQTTHALETTIAHELTHHALAADHDRAAVCASLPLWAEEGLTQMMEEHIARVSHFTFGRELLARHRELWEEIGFDGFVEGATFQSPVGEEQELSYNLAEALTRSLLSKHKKDFFAFARACRNDGLDSDAAARQYLGGPVQELAQAMVFGEGRS